MRPGRRLRNSRGAASSRCNTVPSEGRMRRLWVGLFCAVTLCPDTGHAQVSQQTADMLRRIFATRDFTGTGFGEVRFIEGCVAYLTLKLSSLAPGSSDIVRYESATGARR